MAARFVLKKGSTGKYRFNLVATNGQVIATSEAYESKASAIKRHRVGEAQRPHPGDRRPDRQVAGSFRSAFYIGLAVPGRPIGPWSRRNGAPEESASRRDRAELNQGEDFPPVTDHLRAGRQVADLAMVVSVLRACYESRCGD
jgi:uncharacterized protein YegP (UPF0339 family)